MYGDAVKKHLDRGGILAWGVVPTSLAIRNQTVDSLVKKFEKGVDNLIAKTGISRQQIVEQALVTPSCGTGSMLVEDAEKVFSLLGQLSKALKVKYGF